MNQAINKSEPDNPLIFLSYAKEDKERVRRIYRRLIAERLNVWWDLANLLPGQEWEKVIVNTIKNAHCVIVFLSNYSVNKRGYIQKEIRVALEAAEKIPEGEIFIIPVRLDECLVPEGLTKWQWIDGFRPRELNKIILSLKTKFVQEAAKLVIVEDSKREMSFTLEKDISSIGRKDIMGDVLPDIDLSFIDPRRGVSRRHARIMRRGKTFYVEDLASRNGTVINRSIRLSPHVSYPLKNGDVLQLAEITLKFVAGVGANNTADTKSLKSASRSIGKNQN